MNHNIIKKASDIINETENAYFSYMDENGYPHTATRTKMKSEGIMSCFFSTNFSGSMAQAIIKDNRASVCFQKDNDNITLMGTATIINDEKIKKELWIDWFINHYPLGPSDPEYYVVKFNTKQLSLWVDREIAKFSLDEVNQITSRCGLLCQSCDFKEAKNCGTCIETKGNPFYGQCPIAICCQEKNYMHCGQCEDMPCNKLYEYSCGDGEHCDKPKGARLNILNMWNGLN